MEELLEDCPDCGARVLVMEVQGGMRLDYPAVDREENPAAIFGLLLHGSVWLAGAGGQMRGSTGHVLHEHQPPGLD